MIIYAFGTIATKGETIAELLYIRLELVLLPLHWLRISSMIILAASWEMELFSQSAHQDPLLLSMFFLMIGGTIVALYQITHQERAS